MFASDVMKKIKINSEISFIKLKSYSGIQSTGTVKELLGLELDLSGRHIIILEDIVDSGKTMHDLFKMLKSKKVASVKLFSLLVKPNALKYDIKIDYTGFEVPNDFLVGYGLDYNEQGRNLNEIYKLVE